jgi:Tol biopolymer transport system component
MRTLLTSIALVLLATVVAAQTPPLAALSEPGISPDGREVAFVSGGDIWTVPASGGEARLLVSDPAMEARPLFSPDGRMLAFTSSRTGNGDVYVLELATGSLRRLTWDDARDQLDNWSRDGKWLYFSSTSRDISGMNDVYRVAVTGGTPMQVSGDRYVNEFFAAPAPNGNAIAIDARGIASQQWWRHGRSHIDESQIWLLTDPSAHTYEPVTADGAKEIWPMWTPDGQQLYYISDRSGTENIWTTRFPAAAGKPAQVTKFNDGRALWPSISTDGKTIVFERDFGLWRLDTQSGNAAPIAVSLRGVPAAAAVEHRRITDRFQDLALSPDGKKFAFVARGDIFAATAKEGGDAVRITNTAALESQIVWSPDSRTIVYASDRDGGSHLFQYDFATEREKQLTSGAGADDSPRFSPDGKSIAFQRNARDLMVLDVASGDARSIATARFDRQPFGSGRPFDWSPDNKWIAYLNYGDGLFRNAYVVSVAGGSARPVSFIANTNTDFLEWSPDGKFLLMVTGQRTENNRIARIDLTRTTPKFREDQFRDLFREPEKKTDDKEKDATPAKLQEKTAPEPKKKAVAVDVDYTGIRERLQLLPVSLDADQATISPDGKWIAFVATVGDDENVYVYSIDELASEAVPKQISATSSRKRSLQFSSDSKEVFYLDGGKVTAATIDPARPRTIATTAEMDVDFARERDAAFRQAWTYQRDNFFDAKMNGVDWNAVRERFAPRVAAARTPDDFRRLLNLMVGELNASHSGANPPADQARTSTGRLGVRYDRDEYERNARLRVSEVIELSPADVAKIRVGETIASVDGQPVNGTTNIDQLLDYKIGKRTVIGVVGADGARRDVTLQPIRNTEEKGLTYRAWVNANRAYVDKVSGGKLGYVHMIDMSSQSLERLFVDLDAENRSKQGVVVDVRNNNGGFVNVYAIDVLSRRHYLSMTSRDFPTAPARTLLGQRSLEKPTILVTNRHSLSDAEDFTEGYRSLALGKVVGEPTAGWIIYTSNTTLVDGTNFRLPSTRITDANGNDLERNPRPVDRFVQRPIGEWYQGKDAQLDAAVQELLATTK